MLPATFIQFFKHSKQFAVVGASTNTDKIGNRVLKWYISQGLNVIPVHPKEPEIEGLKTISSISELQNPSETALSIITPPSVTKKVVETAIHLNIKHIWIQPGAEDDESVNKAIQAGINVIHGGDCILVAGRSALSQSRL